MKKVKLTLAVMISALLISTPLALQAANSEITFPYNGKEAKGIVTDEISDITPKSSMFGSVTVDGDVFRLADGGWQVVATEGMDCPGMVAYDGWSSAKYIGLFIENTADGDVCLTFESKHEDGTTIIEYSPALNKAGVILLDEDGNTVETAYTAEGEVAENNGRYGIYIPQDFTGTMLVPLEGLAYHTDLKTAVWGTSIHKLSSIEFHLSNRGTAIADTAATGGNVTMTISSIFIVNELPAASGAPATATPKPDATAGSTSGTSNPPKTGDSSAFIFTLAAAVILSTAFISKKKIANL